MLSISDSATSTAFAADVRETLLQDTESADEGLLESEFVAQLCYELAYRASSEWHYIGYATLWRLVRMPLGKEILEDMDRRGDLIKDLVQSAFDK